MPKKTSWNPKIVGSLKGKIAKAVDSRDRHNFHIKTKDPGDVRGLEDLIPSRFVEKEAEIEMIEIVAGKSDEIQIRLKLN